MSPIIELFYVGVECTLLIVKLNQFFFKWKTWLLKQRARNTELIKILKMMSTAICSPKHCGLIRRSEKDIYNEVYNRKL